ncbi:sugar-binding domain-containing protein [Bacteroides cutis]|uniref:sugar-binding domain-containing protein n=1 Tax=Bacteroides cutis TaxID=2024197 RepID=UPI000C77C143|nr:sugar-binding domain-containing protein [Bacteroides cutis]
MKKIGLLIICVLIVLCGYADDFRFSTAGFYELPNMGREVYSLNQAWRFWKGDVDGAPYVLDYDDTDWEVVSIPHGLEYLPVEASGGANYQGVAWYRKHFTPADSLKGKKMFVHFEGIMGKSEVYVNGNLVKKHYGGYLPVILEVSDLLKFGVDNVIAVKADNSDDPTYPVGKEQSLLDFTYFGGIYRDCWLVAHNNIFITNANYEKEEAGGLFVSYDKVSDVRATVNLKAHIRNVSGNNSRMAVCFSLKTPQGEVVKEVEKNLTVMNGKARYVTAAMTVDSPFLWSPESPYLYHLDICIKNASGRILDGYRQRIGIRSIEFKKTEGLWLNGKPYKGKIMGTNRHQDFAVLGNAVPNSLQWRDAKKLRDAGMKVIRTHYVIDPAFMDACDELGLFALVETPGWQFWSDEPVFGERVYSDIRNMIRIHRNHASLFFWEPILNETHYPETFAKRALEICEEEYPYPYSIAACDHGAAGDHYYDLLLRPIESELRSDKTYFIREWGDNVDDWNAQNSDSRVARGWGEVPMLMQAEHYANPDYPCLCYETICQKPSQIVGACFWHSFDHQRGYHADPFYGGIMDAFRQPKTSYYMFMSQREAERSDLLADNGPMVYIAHELTPFSPKDITVYSNCEEVRLTVFKDGQRYTYKKDLKHEGMPSPIIRFTDVFRFMEWKAKARAGKQNEAYLLAEGLMNGKVVTTHKRYPSGQADHIRLRIDDEGMGLKADGSDVVTIIAEVVDKRGTVKRLNNSIIRFTVEGEGRLVGDAVVGVNPMPVVWGSAPVLIQSTGCAGKIRVTAALEVPGQVRPLEGVLKFESVPTGLRQIYDMDEMDDTGERKQSIIQNISLNELEKENARLRKELNRLKVKEVEKQQTQFGMGIND